MAKKTDLKEVIADQKDALKILRQGIKSISGEYAEMQEANRVLLVQQDAAQLATRERVARGIMAGTLDIEWLRTLIIADGLTVSPLQGDGDFQSPVLQTVHITFLGDDLIDLLVDVLRDGVAK